MYCNFARGVIHGFSKTFNSEKRLESLKKIWWEDTEIEWINVSLDGPDGPTVLTKNAVDGNQMGLETKELLKQYKREGTIR